MQARRVHRIVRCCPKDDTVNLYIYPATGEGYTDPASYDLTAAIRYINANTEKSVQVSTGKMQLTTDDSGRPVFYAVGLNTSYMEGINGIDVGGQSLRSIQAPISYGILERVRGGVLIETHRLNGVADAGLGGTMGISARQSDDSVQRMLLCPSGYDYRNLCPAHVRFNIRHRDYGRVRKQGGRFAAGALPQHSSGVIKHGGENLCLESMKKA